MRVGTYQKSYTRFAHASNALPAPSRAAQVRETQDLRAKIYGILSKVGFEGHESLSIRERQHVELLKLSALARLCSETHVY